MNAINLGHKENLPTGRTAGLSNDAKARGDTKNVGTFDRDINIKVLMPEMVRCSPQREHGDGDPFMNSLEDLVQGSGSAMEAGLLVMGATAAQISDEKLSLEDQIQTASSVAEQGRGFRFCACKGRNSSALTLIPQSRLSVYYKRSFMFYEP